MMQRQYSDDTVNLIKTAFDRWQETESREGLLTDWLLFQRALKQHPYGKDDVPLLRRLNNALLLSATEQLQQQSPKHAQTLQVRFMDGEVEQQAARQLGISVATMYRWQRHALQAVTRIVVAQEQATYANSVAQQLAHLPTPTYAQLIGVADKLSALLERITQPAAPNWFLICGIGGIGKTSLIRALTERTIEQLAFERVIWVEVTHSELGERPQFGAVKQILNHLARLADVATPSEGQLRQWFAQAHTLLVIDNVEAPEDAAAIRHYFREWTTHAKLIVTSRARPTGLQGVHVTLLDELSQSDALALINHLAETSGQDDLLAAPDEQLVPIYERTGGNPHAIKLVMGLAATRPIQRILADLPKAKHGETEALYRHIYWRAWRSLSPDAQQLFMAMRWIGAQGSTPEHIRSLTTLDEDPFWNSAETLLIRSLLIQAGTSLAPRYRIHRLSEQFLQEQVLKW